MAADAIFNFIDRQDDGAYSARHGHFTLKSALQPIFRQRLDGALFIIGYEGLLRPYLDEYALAPKQFFSAADQLLVENVDCLSRLIHVLNHGTSPTDDEQLIFTSFHPALLNSRQHLHREFERLKLCAREVDLPERNIVCQVSAHLLPDLNHLSYFAEQSRGFGFQLAISHIDPSAIAMPAVFALRPDYLKLTREWVEIGLTSPPASTLLRRIIERCAVLEIETILTGIETDKQLAFCRQFHPVHLQGHRVSKPILAEHGFNPQIPKPSTAFPNRRAARIHAKKKPMFSNAFPPIWRISNQRPQPFGKRSSI